MVNWALQPVPSPSRGRKHTWQMGRMQEDHRYHMWHCLGAQRPQKKRLDHRCNLGRDWSQARHQTETQQRDTEQKEGSPPTRLQQKNTVVRKCCKRDRKAQAEELASEAEAAVRQNNTKELYRITWKLADKNKNKSFSWPIRDKKGNLFTIESQQLERWKNTLRKS